MKAPICEACLENDMLCEGCRKKLEKGEIDESTVDISKFIYSLKEEHPHLEDVDINKIYSCDEVIVIVTPAEDVGKVVGRGGEVVKKLASEWDRSIRVVEHSDDPREFARNLLPNVKIYSINQVFTPEGEYFKATVQENEKNRVILSETKFSHIVQDVTGELMELEFK